MANILFAFDYVTMWTAIGAIGQGLAAILAIGALIYSMTTFTKSLKTSHYTELDRLYFDLLKIRMEKPHLNLPSDTKRTDSEKVEYDIYAFMLWNYLETIHDRCKDDEHLRQTWYPVVAVEYALHGDWFEREDNQPKFKDEFKCFIRKTYSKKPQCADKTAETV